MRAKHIQLVDKAQFEAEYLKRELENQLKHKEKLLLEKDRNGFSAVNFN